MWLLTSYICTYVEYCWILHKEVWWIRCYLSMSCWHLRLIWWEVGIKKWKCRWTKDYFNDSIGAYMWYLWWWMSTHVSIWCTVIGDYTNASVGKISHNFDLLLDGTVITCGWEREIYNFFLLPALPTLGIDLNTQNGIQHKSLDWCNEVCGCYGHWIVMDSNLIWNVKIKKVRAWFWCIG